jgi:hypothetical protein
MHALQHLLPIGGGSGGKGFNREEISVIAMRATGKNGKKMTRGMHCCTLHHNIL